MLKKILLVLGLVIALKCGYAQVWAMTPIKTGYPHWQKSNITVYIPAKDSQSGAIQQAFQAWQGSSSGKLNFSYVVKKPADIEVVFNDNARSAATPIASYSISTKGQEITGATISIASKGKKIKSYSKPYIQAALEHIVGRVIGMPANPRKKSSIMFSPVAAGQSIMKIDVMKLYKVYGWSYSERRISQ